jgi:N-methylhydantoinase B/oxoprolinase/acetone carboxylase alpha subunit
MEVFGMVSTQSRFQVDPITLEIIKNTLISTCKEMGGTMVRTAYSPIFSEGRDFSTALFDANCEMIAQGVGCPAQLGALQFTVEWCVKDIGIEHLNPGDVILHNDVYRGGTHLPEFTMIRPIFQAERLIAFAANIGHHVDIGGKSPGGFPGDATDVFMEGFRLPPVKIFIAGEKNEVVWDIILANVRTPRNSYGDMLAMHASLLTAERRLGTLIEKYGVDKTLFYFEQIKSYSERRMREEIFRIPDGFYENDDFMDDDGVSEGGPHKIHVGVLIDGSTIVMDFTGTDEQTDGPINCPFGVTASSVYNALMMLTDPTIPTNQGCFRPVKIIAPAGCLVNVEYPNAEFAGNTETHNRIVDTVMGALSQVIPDRVTGSAGGTCCNFTYGGIHPETREQYANYQWEGVGWGARKDKDGNSVLNVYVGNSRIQPIEVRENRFPWIESLYVLATDSGGPGKYRGGMGTVRIMEAQEKLTVNAIADRHLIGPPGLFGGKPGGKTAYLVKQRGTSEFKTFREVFGSKSESKFANIPIKKGDQVMIISSGGGGYGDPCERGLEEVMEDVEKGYVSIKSAKEHYGVVLDPNTGKVDQKQTKELRRNT